MTGEARPTAGDPEGSAPRAEDPPGAKRPRSWPWYGLVPLVYSAFIGADAISHGYFDADDLHNIYWANSDSAWHLVLAALLPWSNLFRPAGLLLYNLLSRAADLDPVPYHAVLLLLNLANVALVHRVVRGAGAGARTAAFVASLYLLPVALLSTFWKFGEIFEVLSASFFFLGFWAFLSLADGWRKSAAVAASFVIAFHAKEIAITLPAVLLFHDLAAGGGRARRRAGTHASLFALASVFVARRRTEMTASPGAPYYLDLRPAALIENGAWYLRALWAAPGFRNAAVAIVLVAAAAITVVCRDRILAFAAAFVPITFLPVIFLTNHRFGFYWYIPSFGAWLWLGRLAENAGNGLAGKALRVAARPAMYLACLAGILVGGAKARSDGLRWQRREAARFRREAGKVRRPCPAAAVRVDADFFPGEPADSATLMYRVLCGDRRLEIRRP